MDAEENDQKNAQALEFPFGDTWKIAILIESERIGKVKQAQGLNDLKMSKKVDTREGGLDIL